MPSREEEATLSKVEVPPEKLPPTAVAASPTAHSVTSARQFDPLLFLTRYGTLCFLILLIIFFSSTQPRFLTLQNIKDMFAAISYLSIIAAGMTVLLAMFEFDLSVGYIAGLAAATAAFLSRAYQVALEPFVAGLIVAGLCGLLNGLLVTRLRITSFVATLATAFVFNGALIWLTGGNLISSGMAPGFYAPGQDMIAGIRLVIIFMAVVLIALWVLLERTAVGREMYAIGGNRVAARLAGIDVRKKVVIGFVITALAAGLAGMLLASNLGQADPTNALGLLFDGFTAVFLGASVLRAGKVHIVGTFIGAITLGVLLNGMTFMNLDFTAQTVAKGLVLLVAVAISQVGRRRQ